MAMIRAYYRYHQVKCANLKFRKAIRSAAQKSDFNKKPQAVLGLLLPRVLDCSRLRLIASIDELNAVTLVLEGAWDIKSSPAAILALILKFRRACFGIASIPRAVQIKIRLIWIRYGRTVIFSVIHAIPIGVFALARATCIVDDLDF